MTVTAFEVRRDATLFGRFFSADPSLAPAGALSSNWIATTDELVLASPPLAGALLVLLLVLVLVPLPFAAFFGSAFFGASALFVAALVESLGAFAGFSACKCACVSALACMLNILREHEPWPLSSFHP
jgi:hypothetical protein